MKKLILLLITITIFSLVGCTSESIIARDHLYNYMSSKDITSDVHQYDMSSYDDLRFGGFSNYGYADKEHLELRYLKDDIYVEVRYLYQYSEDRSGQIDLSVDTVEIEYMNIKENEYLYVVQSNINDEYQFDEKSYDEFIIMLYELRLKDVVWVLTSLGYELK